MKGLLPPRLREHWRLVSSDSRLNLIGDKEAQGNRADPFKCDRIWSIEGAILRTLFSQCYSFVEELFGSSASNFKREWKPRNALSQNLAL
jgi:hypothetical protein